MDGCETSLTFMQEFLSRHRLQLTFTSFITCVTLTMINKVFMLSNSLTCWIYNRHHVSPTNTIKKESFETVRQLNPEFCTISTFLCGARVVKKRPKYSKVHTHTHTHTHTEREREREREKERNTHAHLGLVINLHTQKHFHTRTGM